MEVRVKIERHKIEQDFARKLYEDWLGEREHSVLWSRRDPKNLSMLMNDAVRGVAAGCVVEPESQEIPKALDLAAQAGAALIAAAAASPAAPVTVSLGPGEPVTYTSPPNESTVSVDKWILAFYLNALRRDVAALDALCRISPESLASTTKNPEYRSLYMKGLQEFRAGNRGVHETLIAALEATDPDRPDVYDDDWTLYLDVPQLEVLIYAIGRDAQFGPALAKAVEEHKKYWSKTKDRRRDYDGFICLELTALCSFARERGLTWDVESPYLPTHLAR
jgi:hypothetical protein